MRFYEFSNTIKPIKPLPPEDARIQSMQNQVKTTQQAIKAAKVKKKIAAGQQQLAKIKRT